MLSEKSCGTVPFYKTPNSEIFFLLVHQANGNWSFPKGHKEEEETDKETAIRETEEETGLTDFKIAGEPIIIEYEIERTWGRVHKEVVYFPVEVKDKGKLRAQEGEITDIGWFTYSEAYTLFEYEGARYVLEKARDYATI